MANQIPEKIAMFNAYVGTQMLDGTMDVELPSITFLSDTISGSGIAGEIDSALVGQTESLETVLNFRLPTEQAMKLLNPMGTTLTLRAGMQTIDRATGETLPQGFRVTMRVKPKGLELGSLTVGEATETSMTFEALTLSIYIGNKSLLEIDKMSSVFKVNGIDYLDPYRKLA